MKDSRSIHTKEQAAMMRAQLKARFPGTKFSVRMKEFAGGSSIDITWTDGPSKKLVHQLTEPYEGKGFDGMTDSTTYRTSWLLEDGRVTTPNGFLKLEPAAPEGAKVEVVNFYAWIHIRRELSPRFRERIMAQLQTFYGGQVDAGEIDRLVYQAAEDATKFSLPAALQAHNERAQERIEIREFSGGPVVQVIPIRKETL